MVNSAIVPVGFDVHFSVRFFLFSFGHWATSVGIRHQRRYKIIHFLRTTLLPNGAAALRGPAHNALMTSGSKVVWPVSQLRRKDCSCTMHRCCEAKGPEAGIQNIRI